MWELSNWKSPYRLQFTDGKDVNWPRGGSGTSYRLVVDTLGFIDLTEADVSARLTIIDANGSRLAYPRSTRQPAPIVILSLTILNSNGFTLSFSSGCPGTDAPNIHEMQGEIRAFPRISPSDCDFIRHMIEEKYIPYQKLPEGEGKSEEEIMILAEQLFPFELGRFELAMAVYDWTTASFTRLVLPKIFEYTNYPSQGDQRRPLDLHSLAQQIWLSDWDTFTPQDTDFMRSFLMEPAHSELDVELQLLKNHKALRLFSDVENRLLSAAMQSLPRTSVIQCPALFSGQVDISQLGLDHFAVEFLESPLNEGPISRPLIHPFEDAFSTMITKGSTLTSKAVMSFTDSVKSALHYSNGILLIATQGGDSLVWERASYVTSLSEDTNKNEYTFTAGTQFEVQNVDKVTFEDKPLLVIYLQVTPERKGSGKALTLSTVMNALSNGPRELETGQLLSALVDGAQQPHMKHRTGGRRCNCLPR